MSKETLFITLYLAIVFFAVYCASPKEIRAIFEIIHVFLNDMDVVTRAIIK